MNDLLTFLEVAPHAASDLADAPEIRLQAVSTRSGAELLPGLMDAIDCASGWVLQRRMVSASMLQMRMEIQGRFLMDLYASLLEQGLELSRDSHLLLAERCSCAHMHRQAGGSIVALHLNVALPAELPPLGRWWRGRVA